MPTSTRLRIVSRKLNNEEVHKVLISIAANCEQKKNLSEARRRLEQVLSASYYTSEMWTEPIGAQRSDAYLNQLVTAHTRLELSQLNSELKRIEQEMGRTDSDRKEGIVRIDLDLMEYDGERHHIKDWERSYIKMLLPLLPSANG